MKLLRDLGLMGVIFLGNFFRVILHMGERASCFAVVGFCFCFLIFPSPRDPGLGSWFEAAIFGGWAYL
jgi:hypothetical protein